MLNLKYLYERDKKPFLVIADNYHCPTEWTTEGLFGNTRYLQTKPGSRKYQVFRGRVYFICAGFEFMNWDHTPAILAYSPHGLLDYEHVQMLSAMWNLNFNKHDRI